MTAEQFYAAIEEIGRAATAFEIYVSPDFQCDQTGGFPVSLCVCWEQGKAWLQLNESMIEDGQDVSSYEQMCADWGIRPCWDTEQFNKLLRGLGEDAYDNAYLAEEDATDFGW